MPYSANAGFLSFLAGTEVSAQSDIIGSNINSQNSQTMGLLVANVFSAPTLQDKTPKDSKTISEGDIQEDAIVSIFSDNALMPTASPTDIVQGLNEQEFSSDQISVYVVRKGDSLAQIAKMFDVSVDTILSANDMKKGDAIKEGDVLLILPFSGIEHVVVKGETLQGIANKYKVATDEILFFNEMEADAKLAIGERIIIPGGSLSVAVSSPSKTKISGGGSSVQTSGKTLGGYFVNPVPGARKSRGSTPGHKGVDLAASTGTPILASAAGRVKFARTGYNGGFGNLVIISHPNGTETLYAHQSRLATSMGEQVAQGEIIGYVGNTGRSRGAHLHFEVHGAKNPGDSWSWKK